MRPFLRSALLLFLAFTVVLAATPAPRSELRDGDRVVFLGDTLVEREQSYGWSADTPAAVPATAVESATPTPILFKIVRNRRHQPFAPNRDLNRQAMSAPFRT